MTSYEDDHNLKASATSGPAPLHGETHTRRHRLQLSDFFQHSISPLSPSTDIELTPILETLLRNLQASNVGGGGGTSNGVPDGWTDRLDRIPKAELAPGDVCPICNQAFLDDPYPLVVRLPCHERHWFDLDCIQIWLKVQSTCPLDRTNLLKKKDVTDQSVPLEAANKAEEQEEEEWEDTYG